VVGRPGFEPGESLTADLWCYIRELNSVFISLKTLIIFIRFCA
jgi:hypothetical protein